MGCSERCRWAIPKVFSPENFSPILYGSIQHLLNGQLKATEGATQKPQEQGDQKEGPSVWQLPHLLVQLTELNLGSGIPGCLPYREEELLSPTTTSPVPQPCSSADSCWCYIRLTPGFANQPQNSLSLSIPSRLSQPASLGSWRWS